MSSKTRIRTRNVFDDYQEDDFYFGNQEDPAMMREREKQDRRRDEFIVNKGKVLETIREDIPSLFVKHPELKMFRDDVRLHIQVQRLGIDTLLIGKRKYKGWFEGFRWTSKAIFDIAQVSQLIIRKDLDPMSPTIRVRWKVRAHPWLSMREGGYPVHLDFVSVFQLDETGMVQEHCITDVEPPRIQTNQELALLQSLTAASCESSGDQAWPVFEDEIERHW